MKKKFSLIKISKKDAENQTEIYVPFHESDIETSKKFKTGQEIAGSATVSDLRNLGHHRKLFALLKMTFENMPEKYSKLFKNTEELLTEIKIQTGHRERRESLSGKVYYIPKSIAFHNLGQEAFSEFYNSTLDIICQFILPGIQKESIENEILNFM